MTLKRVNQFHCNQPALLERELNAVEDNVSAETASIRSSYIPVWRPRKLVCVPGGSILAAQYGDQISIDTLRGAATITLPVVAAANYGKSIRIIWWYSTTNTVTLACVSPGDRIFLSSSPVGIPSSKNVTTVYLDENGYWF